MHRVSEQIRVDPLFYTLKPGEERMIRDARKLGRHRVHISGLRLTDGAMLILVSDHFEPQAIQVYGLRWEIETLFGCLLERTWVQAEGNSCSRISQDQEIIGFTRDCPIQKTTVDNDFVTATATTRSSLL